MALKAKNKRLFGEDGRAREDIAAQPASFARDTCLQAGMCMRHFFGWPHCEHACDREYVEGMKDGVFDQLIASMLQRVARYEREKALKLLKRIYFG